METGGAVWFSPYDIDGERTPPATFGEGLVSVGDPAEPSSLGLGVATDPGGEPFWKTDSRKPLRRLWSGKTPESLVSAAVVGGAGTVAGGAGRAEGGTERSLVGFMGGGLGKAICESLTSVHVDASCELSGEACGAGAAAAAPAGRCDVVCEPDGRDGDRDVVWLVRSRSWVVRGVPKRVRPIWSNRPPPPEPWAKAEAGRKVIEQIRIAVKSIAWRMLLPARARCRHNLIIPIGGKDCGGLANYSDSSDYSVETRKAGAAVHTSWEELYPLEDQVLGL